MSSREGDLDPQVEAAWAAFRGRLADRVAAMEDDDIVQLEVMTGVDPDELSGAAPYLQLVCWAGDQVRAEVAGSMVLDHRYELTPAGEALLVEQGWVHPDDADDLNFVHDAEVRDADRLAVMSVAVLREVFGVQHPVFVLGEAAAPDDSSHDVDDADDADDDDDDEFDTTIPVFVTDRDQLQSLVDRALAVVLGHDPVHDDDGDVIMSRGHLSLRVHVSDDRPGVDLVAELVLDVDDLDRLSLELDILNRTHPVAKFFTRHGYVVMSQSIVAMPFVPMQLGMFIDARLGEIDELTDSLLARVGGRRPAETESAHPAAAAVLTPLQLAALFELLHDGFVPPAEVALLFDHDRHLLVTQLVALRTGRQACLEHDLDVVLEHLRGALRFVVERQARAELGPSRKVAPQRSQQLTLMPEEMALDLGDCDQQVS